MHCCRQANQRRLFGVGIGTEPVYIFSVLVCRGLDTKYAWTNGALNYVTKMIILTNTSSILLLSREFICDNIQKGAALAMS
jgi:hypothetical protein